MIFGKNFLRQMLVIIALLASLGAHAQVERFVEGVHYSVLPDVIAMDEASTKAEVMEVFWFGCPHCYEFDPMLTSWADAQAANINFSRSPLIVWSAAAKQPERLFFTMQQLGKAEDLHSRIFDEVQLKRNPLTDEKSASELFAANGVTAADFKSAYTSFAVDTQLRKHEAMQKKIGVPSVPLLIVNGKYMVQGNSAVASQQAMIDVVEFLIGKDKN